MLERSIDDLVKETKGGLGVRKAAVVRQGLEGILSIYNWDCVTELMREAGGLESPGGRRILAIEASIRRLPWRVQQQSSDPGRGRCRILCPRTRRGIRD